MILPSLFTLLDNEVPVRILIKACWQEHMVESALGEDAHKGDHGGDYQEITMRQKLSCAKLEA
jgi:hypothetical protein